MQFNFTHDAEVVMSDDFYYDLFNGGYIKPEVLLDDEAQIAAVKAAVDLIEEFLAQAVDAEVLEEC